MKNLDQIRAAGAASAADSTSKQAVSKLPALIMSNGLLSAIAFSDERKDHDQPKREKMKNAMDAVAKHLAKPIHGIGILQNKVSGRDLIAALSGGQATSDDLQRATAEALAFLSYLKRFTTKEEQEQ